MTEGVRVTDSPTVHRKTVMGIAHTTVAASFAVAGGLSFFTPVTVQVPGLAFPVVILASCVVVSVGLTVGDGLYPVRIVVLVQIGSLWLIMLLRRGEAQSVVTVV